MVQLKSFKSVADDSNSERMNNSETEREHSANNSSSRSTSIGSTLSTTIVGGNLTSVLDEDTSIQSTIQTNESEGLRNMREGGNDVITGEVDGQQSSSVSAISSHEEYQSAVHELAEDESIYPDEKEINSSEEENNEPNRLPQSKNNTYLEQGKLEDIAKRRAAAAAAFANTPTQQTDQDSTVTRINIEKGLITNLNNNAQQQNEHTPTPHRFTGQQVVTPGETPRIPRAFRLNMQRSQTSPCLQQLDSKHGSVSPLVHHHRLRHSSSRPVVTSASPAIRRAAAAAASYGAGDNTSQFSFSTQKNYANHFEIRWQNVNLHAKSQRVLMPKLITDSCLYQYFNKRNPDTMRAEMCYSPPVQHKNIPPTIAEDREIDGLEMRLGTTITENHQLESAPHNSVAGEGRCILKSISGQVFSGQMTAILGPSGVGKTTLLNSLTGRNTLDGTGRVSLIGATTRKRMSVVTVPQIDVLPGKLTTWEDLLFTSRLKNPQVKYENHLKNIQRIVKHLHMDKFLHTPIDKLSGGEERRLSIGRELLASPDIMILDEPTSGLDANTCKKIITALRDIVEHSDNILDKPMSIIVTIHQPQQEVYNLFHRVYVMAVGGRVIYEGPPQMLLPTIVEQSSLARVTPSDQLNENPAIVAIEVASGEYGPQIINELADYHEDQVYEEFSILGNFAQFDSATGEGGVAASPIQTPRTLRTPRKSPMSVSRFEFVGAHTPSTNPRKRLGSFGDGGSIGRPTPILAKRQFSANNMDKMSSITSVSYASTYDAELPEVTSKLKVDKRLRRSVVMKFNLLSHTWTLMQRCWLLATRDMFLMAIRIMGFLLVAGGTVQIFAGTLDPNEHICPQFESEVDDVVDYITTIRQRLLGLAPMLQQSNAVHLFFFHILLCITMVTSALTGLVFPLQMRMFMREYKNGWYSPASFILSQTLAELPVDIIGPLITLLITYPLCNQPESAYYWREIGYAFVFVICSIICKSQAQIAGAFLMDSVENSVFISCVCVTGPALLSGIPIRITQMAQPLQWVSLGSFLRYSFESLMALRYGYGMCPCDPELVNGYPVVTSPRAIPPQLNSFARGMIDLNQPINQTTTIPAPGSIDGLAGQTLDATHDNIILKFIRLVTEAGNLMVPHSSELGDCDKYRSLYLMAIDVPNNILPRWLGIMIVMFIISRILTYFVVKTVIKLRKN